MGDHIVRRGPPTRPPQPRTRHPTAEIPQHQLRTLIDHATGDALEAELELVDALPRGIPEGTPDSLPNVASQRYAHTMRRGMQAVAVPTRRPPPVPAVTATPPAGRLALATPPVPAPVRKPLPPPPRLARSSDSMLPARSARAMRRAAVLSLPVPGAVPQAMTPLAPAPEIADENEPVTLVVASEFLASLAAGELRPAAAAAAPAVIEPQAAAGVIEAPKAPAAIEPLEAAAAIEPLEAAAAIEPIRDEPAMQPSLPVAGRTRLILPLGLVLLAIGVLAIVLL